MNFHRILRAWNCLKLILLLCPVEAHLKVYRKCKITPQWWKVWKILKFKIKNKCSHIFGLLYQKASSNIKLTVLEWLDVSFIQFVKVFCLIFVKRFFEIVFQYKHSMHGLWKDFQMLSKCPQCLEIFNFILTSPWCLFVCLFVFKISHLVWKHGLKVGGW